MKKSLITSTAIAAFSSLSLLPSSLVLGMDKEEGVNPSRSQIASAKVQAAQEELQKAQEEERKAKEKQRGDQFSEKWNTQKAVNKEATGEEKLDTSQKVKKETERLGNQLQSGAERVGEKLSKIFR